MECLYKLEVIYERESKSKKFKKGIEFLLNYNFVHSRESKNENFKKKLNVLRNKKLSVAGKDQRPLFTLKVAQCAPTLLNCSSAFTFS